MTQAKSSATAVPDRRTVWGAFAVLFIIALVPVLIVHIAALEDYPQHLARVYILGNLQKSALLRQYYLPNWSFQPNLAIEIVLLPLTKFVGVDAAGKFFLALLLFSLSGGIVALHRAIHGRWSLWPLLAFFFLYNRIFLGGMANYLFTLGLSFWALAAWICLRDRPAWIRAGVSIPVALVLLLGHLAAFGVYALMLAGYELSRHLQSARKWYAVSPVDVAAAGSQFAVAAAVLLTFSSASGMIAKYRFEFLQKFDAPFNLFYNYHLAFDAATFLGFVLLLLIGLGMGWIVVSRRLILSIVILVLAFLAMPYGMASGIGADRRLTLPIALLIIAATDWKPERVRWRMALLAGLAGLFLVRMVIIADNWLAADRIFAQYLAAFDRLAPGARMAVAIAHNSNQTTTNPPLNGIAQYAIIRRDAFVSNTFTLPGQQPLSFTPRYTALARQLPVSVYDRGALVQLRDPILSAGIDPFSCAHLSGYDNLLVIHEADFPVKPPGWLVPIAGGTDFRLFRVGPCAQP
jgi:hypothetical protein